MDTTLVETPDGKIAPKAHPEGLVFSGGDASVQVGDALPGTAPAPATSPTPAASPLASPAPTATATISPSPSSSVSVSASASPLPSGSPSPTVSPSESTGERAARGAARAALPAADPVAVPAPAEQELVKVGSGAQQIEMGWRVWGFGCWGKGVAGRSGVGGGRFLLVFWGVFVARVVCVHGMGQQVQGEDRLRSVWWPALSDGLRRAGAAEELVGELVGERDVAMGFYGDLFRPAGRFLSNDMPYTAGDVEDGFEQELLAAWWQGASQVDPEVVAPDADGTMPATPRSVQAALRALSGSKFFANLALRAVVADLKQVRAYLTDQQVREQVRARVMAQIGEDTRVVVAHSLGSVVAYEALCALPGHEVRALVTIGSPLGIRNLVFDRLQPAPARDGKQLRGAWPGGEHLAWTNLAGTGDVVALVKDLRPLFGERQRSATLSNGVHAHDATSYLTDALCGRAIAGGLA